MRQIIYSALLAASALLAVVPVAAESAVRLPPLAPGEVLLEVDGIGIVRTPATAATVTTVVLGHGGTRREAEQSLAAEVERVRTAARAAGATDADIGVDSTGVDDLTRMVVVADRIEAASEGRDHSVEIANRITIRLRNPGHAAELHDRLNPSSSYGRLSQPVYEIADPAAARRQARNAALGQARADADAYAEALGMRVVRILRATERAGFDYLGTLLTDPEAIDYVSNLGPGYLYYGRTPRAEVATAAVVGVDYVLAPR